MTGKITLVFLAQTSKKTNRPKKENGMNIDSIYLLLYFLNARVNRIRNGKKLNKRGNIKKSIK